MKLILKREWFDPALTLDEQVFHWVENQGVYSAVCAGHVGRLVPCVQGYYLETQDEQEYVFWRAYFDLDRDYEALAAMGEKYPVIRQALALLPGLRVLNQPPWEALVAFIISANNNTGRIRKLVLSLCREVGGGESCFPTPEALAAVSEERLRQMGMGYRAPFLKETARKVVEGFPLEELSALSYEEAHSRLITLPGVGDKVADCVQLFGLRHSVSFPVDVWVERLMRSWFATGTMSRKAIGEHGRQILGKNAGVAQQYLFHCARRGLIPLDKGA